MNLDESSLDPRRACFLTNKHNLHRVLSFSAEFVLFPDLTGTPNSRLISLLSENVEINPACYCRHQSTVAQFI